MNIFNKNNGFSLIELLVAMGLLTIFIPALVSGISAARSGKVQQEQRLGAMQMLKETEEAARAVRNNDWANIKTPGTFYPSIFGNTWILNLGTQTTGGYTRSIVISDVSRDSVTGNISPTGTIPDPSVKKVDILVSWSTPFYSHVDSTFYLSRFNNNNYFIDTSVNDFSKTGNILSNTQLFSPSHVNSSADGQIILSPAGSSDWCSPTLTPVTIDLPKSGVANAVSAIEGRVFAGTGDSSAGVSFADVSITNTNPPSGSIISTFDGYKTNGVFGDTGYAYIATDNNSKEVVVIDLNQIIAGKFVEAGSFNAPNNGNAGGVFVTTNYGYMTSSSGNKLYNFNKIGSALPLDGDGVALDGLGKNIFVVGNYAYVSIDSAANQLDIIDISNPTNLVKIKSFSVNGSNGIGLFVKSDGTRVYLATAGSASKPEFFIIDVTVKTNPIVLGSYDTTGMSPKGITIAAPNRGIIVGTGGTQQYQVVDLTAESSPVHCTAGGKTGGLAIPTGVNGVSSVQEADGDVYSYIITGDASSELKIIEGGSGAGGLYKTNGYYTSSTFQYPTLPTAPNLLAFNRFDVNYKKTANTDIQFQIAFANPAGDCTTATYIYVGPLATGTDYFLSGPVSASPVTQSFPIPLSLNPGKCFRYKVYLTTTDSNTTPEINDVTLNYSP